MAGRMISPGSDAVEMLASWLSRTAMLPLTESRSVCAS